MIIPELMVVGDKKEILTPLPLQRKYPRRIISRGDRNKLALQHYPNSVKESTRKLPFEVHPLHTMNSNNPIQLPSLSEKSLKRIPLMPLNGQPKALHVRRTNCGLGGQYRENCPVSFKESNAVQYWKNSSSGGTPKFKCDNETVFSKENAIISRHEIAKRSLSKASRLVNDENSLNERASSKWHPKVIKFRSKRNGCHRLIIPKESKTDVAKVKIEEVTRNKEEGLKQQHNYSVKTIPSNKVIDSFNLTFGEL